MSEQEPHHFQITGKRGAREWGRSGFLQPSGRNGIANFRIALKASVYVRALIDRNLMMSRMPSLLGTCKVPVSMVRFFTARE